VKSVRSEIDFYSIILEPEHATIRLERLNILKGTVRLFISDLPFKVSCPIRNGTLYIIFFSVNEILLVFYLEVLNSVVFFPIVSVIV